MTHEKIERIIMVAFSHYDLDMKGWWRLFRHKTHLSKVEVLAKALIIRLVWDLISKSSAHEYLNIRQQTVSKYIFKYPEPENYNEIKFVIENEIVKAA